MKKLFLKIKQIFLTSSEKIEVLQEIDLSKAELELELNELKENLKKEKELNYSLEREKEKWVNAKFESEMERIFTNIAFPLSQLLLQENLIKEGKNVSTEDIMKIVKSLINTFNEVGLKQLSNSEEQVQYNEATMLPLRSDYFPIEGEKVIIKMPGFEYKGITVRKSFIVRIGS